MNKGAFRIFFFATIALLVAVLIFLIVWSVMNPTCDIPYLKARDKATTHAEWELRLTQHMKEYYPTEKTMASFIKDKETALDAIKTAYPGCFGDNVPTDGSCDRAAKLKKNAGCLSTIFEKVHAQFEDSLITDISKGKLADASCPPGKIRDYRIKDNTTCKPNSKVKLVCPTSTEDKNGKCIGKTPATCSNGQIKKGNGLTLTCTSPGEILCTDSSKAATPDACFGSATASCPANEKHVVASATPALAAGCVATSTRCSASGSEIINDVCFKACSSGLTESDKCATYTCNSGSLHGKKCRIPQVFSSNNCPADSHPHNSKCYSYQTMSCSSDKLGKDGACFSKAAVASTADACTGSSFFSAGQCYANTPDANTSCDNGYQNVDGRCRKLVCEGAKDAFEIVGDACYGIVNATRNVEDRPAGEDCPAGHDLRLPKDGSAKVCVANNAALTTPSCPTDYQLENGECRKSQLAFRCSSHQQGQHQKDQCSDDVAPICSTGLLIAAEKICEVEKDKVEEPL